MDIKIERIFDAPVEKVWKAWTDSEEIKKWWGPKDFTAPVVEADVKVGGKFLGLMRGAMGPGQPIQDSWSGGEYIEVIPMQKIVSWDYFTDPEGNKITPKEAGMPGEWTEEMKVTVTFEDLGGKTKLNLLHEGHPADFASMAEMGWSQSLDKLEESLKN